jgi:hypothetical protein
MLYEPIRRITVVVLGNADPQLFGPRPEREPAPSTLELAGELGTIAAGLQPGPPGGAPGAGARTH